MDNYDFAVFFFYALSALSSVVQGISGFGDAIILHLGWNIAVFFKPELHNTILGTRDVELIAIMMSLRSVCLQSILAYMTRDGLSYTLCLRMVPSQCIAIVLGSWLLTFMSDDLLKSLLGGIFLLCAAIYVGAKLKNYYHQKQRKERSSAITTNQPDGGANPSQEQPDHLDADGNIKARVLHVAIFAGALAGLGQGLTGAGGPALMLFVLWYDLPPKLARGTIPLSNFASGCFRFAYTQYTGAYNWDAWLCYGALISGGFIGLLAGNEIGQRISDRMFTVFLLSLLFLACITMLGVNPFVVLVLGAINLVIGYGVYVQEQRERAARIEAGEVVSPESIQNIDEVGPSVSNTSVASRISFDG